ncbi:MAG: DUF3108 domain-containing protein [Bacteroidales bacterium]|nr:DUF3108 domain-containing protein [Bacteroidales bacterium]MCF8405085.1 DUF3108 domain-containing protein [Bacteroidales bacterium]
MIKTLILLLYTCFLLLSLSSKAQCVNTEHVFQGGELLKYEVAYNWGFIWVDAGEVSFKTEWKNSGYNPSYYFESYGTSYRFYDLLFKVRDRFQSEVEAKSFRPKWFIRNTSEGGYEVNNRYDFDFENQILYSKTANSEKQLSEDTLSLTGCTYDVLSAIYYARNINFTNYSIGDTIPIKFIIDGEFYELYIRYIGRENKKNRNGKTYDCIKFSALLVEGTIFKGGEDLIVWVTADNNKIPIMAEARILIGSIKAYLTSYENLKYSIIEVSEKNK